MPKLPLTHSYFILVILIVSFAIINISRDSILKAVLIDGDGSGHYSWLPSVFIYHTLDFTEVFENEKTRKGPDYQGHNYHNVNETTNNKFPPGTALLLMPFFVLALIISFISGLPIDGYNFIFQLSVGIAAVFWAWIGLLFLYKLLLSYGVKSKIGLFLTIVAFFGTNLFAYTFLMPAFSHVYSFVLISSLLYFTRRYFLKRDLRSLISASAILGLVFITRPVNVLIIIFLPFLASSLKTFSEAIKDKFKDLKIVWTVLVFLLVVSPYFLIPYLQTGQWFHFSYQNEGFYWSNPQVYNFLFSFRKGWFVYTPLFLLLFPSLYFLYRKSRYLLWWFLAFFTILVFVFSSWWNWFYGDSFGMRPMVDFTSVFVLVIAISLNQLKDKLKRIVLLFILFVVGLNIMQTYQYAKGIIHPDSMNRDAYFHVFFKTSEKYSGRITAGPEYYYGKFEEKPFYLEFNDFEKDYPNWAKLWEPETKQVFAGNKSLRFGNKKIYSPSLNWVIPDSLFNKKNIYVKMESMVFEPKPNAAKNALFIMDIQDKQGNTVFYKGANLKQVPDNKTNKWHKMSTGFKLPHLNKKHYLVKIYVWNPKKTDFVIDNFEVKFYRY